MRVLEAKWHATAAAPDGFPNLSAPEVAFLGRSNVGKSSLLNALVNRKKLARTSSSPGKTRLIHWYHVRYEVRATSRQTLLVDLPGYGYARVSKVERERWQGLVESYLDGRSTLTAAVLLQDIRRDISEDETLLIDWLAEREIPVVLAITKIDKLKPMRRAARIRAIKESLELPPALVIPTSASQKTGLGELWKAVTPP
ncbi:MAG: ribosome biogenesis GTP-binding protein YihA/YsxC [Myxococcota bacterium]